ncbi:ribose-5-phosphate isomerase [Ornithinimicrobium avium]|uniref:Ribose-5-phosphate isomerase B n=1 Tax=Ornithinimicrobium avium TaxID=2283195 RepID=A0A345NLL0_9MICO|nr:ribose-5-phosphate isomerase [Ornithinimicrobium avium]AXH95918.1 ribose-5-phosphate isomerase [Ornithinimicrobium avium]
MRVHIGGDHAAYELQRDLVAWLAQEGHEVVDHGPADYDAQDDYPVYVLRAAEGVAADEDPTSLGIVLGGSGNGEQMAANKVAGIRAGLAWTPELARLTREHNDARVLSLGARFLSLEEGREIAAAFLGTPFSGEERHQRRIDMVSDYESEGILPPLP